MNLQSGTAALRKTLFILPVIMLLSHLPFLFNGYGVEEDSWGLAVNAREMHESGSYIASRLPGHPVQEYVLLSVWDKGPLVMNLLTSLFSITAVVFFSLCLQQLGVKNILAAALAFAFTPVVFINSVSTIDYLWAMAFLFISFYLLLRKVPFWAGVALGLAAGCRITSAVFFLPFAWWLWKEKKNIRSLALFTFSSMLSSAIIFTPVILKYGPGFFTYYDQFPYPPVFKFIYKATIGVWGVPALVALAFFKIAGLKTAKPTWQNLDARSKNVTILSIIVIALYAIAYLRLPQKSAYLIPVVPFVIILGLIFLKPFMFRWLCGILILSSWLGSINLTDAYRGAGFSPLAVKTTIAGQEIFFDALTGPVWSDYTKRKKKESFCKKVRTKIFQTGAPTVLIAGWWYNQLVADIGSRPASHFKIVFYLDGANMRRLINEGYAIHYLPEQERYNDLRYAFGDTKTLATPFIPQTE